jgi:hypothetical protein
MLNNSAGFVFRRPTCYIGYVLTATLMSDTHLKPIFEKLLQWSQQFSQHQSAQPVDGDYYGVPGETVYTTARSKVDGGGRVEVNLTTPKAHQNFSWQAEITIDDTTTGTYKHVLLQTNGEIVETYGKTVTPVDAAGAESLYNTLISLTTES